MSEMSHRPPTRSRVTSNREETRVSGPSPTAYIWLTNSSVVTRFGLAEITDEASALASAEIFDPRKGTFSGFSSPGLAPRAFHQAAVLSATESEVRILVYGGVTAPSAGLPVLLAPNSASPIRLSPAGSATPAGAELLVYNPANHTLTSTMVATSGPHATAFAGGAGLVGGGLLVAGGSTFAPSGAFNRNTPTMLGANGELALGPPATTTASLTFAPTPPMPSPWLLAPSVTPPSPTTARANHGNAAAAMSTNTMAVAAAVSRESDSRLLTV